MPSKRCTSLTVLGQSEPRDDMYVSCSGGGTVSAGAQETIDCTIENDTGYNVSWSVSATSGISIEDTNLGKMPLN